MQNARGVGGSVALLLAVFTVGVLTTPFSSDWATDTALGSVVVSFDDRIRIHYDLHAGDPAPGTPQVEELTQAGVNGGLAFDNNLNLFVANTSNLVNSVVRRAEADPHGAAAFAAAGAPGSLAFAADGTLYAASPGGTIRRYAPGLGSWVDFTVSVNSTACIGIDLAADQTTLFIVSGGRHVFMLPNAHQVQNGATPTTVAFTTTALPGQGAACGIRLLPPQRASLEKRHGGMIIADTRKIERLDAAGISVGTFKTSIPAAQQNWVGVAVDPRLVFDTNNPATGIDPEEWGFWGIDANQKIIARFQTDGGQLPLQTESTGLDVPRGIAINGELRVAQAVRLVTLTSGAGSASFPSGQTQPHVWSVMNATGYDIAVMAYEVRSDGNTAVVPIGTGRCAPTLDVDCRFFDYFHQGIGPFSTPRAIPYSRGRAVGYRVIPFSPVPAIPPSMIISVTYPAVSPTTGGSLCTASPAVSLLRDPYLPSGHDQFQFDHTIAFYAADDGVREGTDTVGFTDYIAAFRDDTLYASSLAKPDPAMITTAQLGSSQPITLDIRDRLTCAPVGGSQLASSLVLTVTHLGTTPTPIKGTVVGDTSQTQSGLSSLGVDPWVFTDGHWRTNLDLTSPPFLDNNYYALCVGASAVGNSRAIGDVCATIKVVKGSGKK